MLTGTIPFAGETAVDVMLKVVSEPVTPPRTRAPGAEITPEAEHLIMKALSKDPLRRHQSMEELHEELQRCYGSVRYRRSIERTAAAAERSVAEALIPAQRNNAQAAGTIVAPSGTPQARNDGASPGAAGSAPILLTRKKERKRTTLPLELQPDPAALEKTPPPVTNGAVGATGGAHDEWSEPARPENENENNWAELDIDAPDGTGG
jgi:serine/threonine protein kinase